MTVGLTLSPRLSAKNLDLKLFTVTDIKDGAADLIVNYPAEYGGVAASVIVDNQDSTDLITVRINRGINTITIPAGEFRAFNDAWIEQINLTGAGNTDTQVTAQVALRTDIGF